MKRTTKDVDVLYCLMHTMNHQPNAPGQGFMEIEMNGLKNIVLACKENSVKRIIYVTFLGTNPDSPSVWVKERWNCEQILINSGLDVTIIRPGYIIGKGGMGFDMTVSRAKSSYTFNLLANGKQKMRNIAIDDLVYYIVGVSTDPRSFGKCYDVGNDEIMSDNERIDATCDLLRRKHPWKFHGASGVMGFLGPFIEYFGGIPKGMINGIISALKLDSIGDPMPIRELLPRSPLNYKESFERTEYALKE